MPPSFPAILGALDGRPAACSTNRESLASTQPTHVSRGLDARLFGLRRERICRRLGHGRRRSHGRRRRRCGRDDGFRWLRRDGRYRWRRRVEGRRRARGRRDTGRAGRHLDHGCADRRRNLHHRRQRLSFRLPMRLWRTWTGRLRMPQEMRERRGLQRSERDVRMLGERSRQDLRIDVLLPVRLKLPRR